MADILGTDADEDLIGTIGNDRIYGFAGKDRLYGKGGNDQLYGGAGNDLLEGGAGSDIMFGGSGDDIYKVDDVGDIVSEETVAGVDDGGIDTVQSSITFTLGRFFERLTLIGTAALDGTGNDLANRITGNDAANTLSGGTGNDTLIGGAGDDRLIGGAGKDTLTGGIGSDTFTLGPADMTSTDKVSDFTDEDWVGILASYYGLREGSGLANNSGTLVLDATYFATVSGSTQGTASGHGQFVFNTTTLSLMWDADGAGTSSAGIALATFNAGAVLSAADFAILPDPPAAPGTGPVEDTPSAANYAPVAPASKSVTTSEDTPSPAVAIGASDVDGDALSYSVKAGAAPANGTVSFNQASGAFIYTPSANVQGSDTFTIVVSDGRGGTTEQAVTVTITPVYDAPTVVKIHDLRSIGSTDPSGLAYNSRSQTLFLCDSEVDETPFSRPSNLFALRTDGTPINSLSLASFTKEPTGLAFDPVTGYLFTTDDDKYKVFWVDPANPTVKRGEFLTKPLGADDPEDVAINPNNGHLFIVNGVPATGVPRRIVETNNTGTQVFSAITLPDVITDPEALAYDAREDVFYVGGGFSCNIWKVDRTGAILSTIDILRGYRNPVNNAGVNVKDLELAPSSDPNDNPGNLSLYVADYGNSHVDDGRLFEINLGDLVLV